MFSLVSEHRAPSWRLQGALLAMWREGEQLYGVTEHALYSLPLEEGAARSLVTWGGEARATYLQEGELSVLVACRGRETQYSLVRLELGSASLRPVTVCSFSSSGLESSAAPWLLVAPAADFRSEFLRWCGPLVAAPRLYLAASRTVSLATDGVKVCRRSQGAGRRCHVQLSSLQPQDVAVDTFSGLAAVLARRGGGEGARQQFLQGDLREVLVCGSRNLLVLTEAGQLWRLGQQQVRLLALVRLVSLYRDSVVAVTEDGAVYCFPPDCAAPCTGSARELLPGGGVREAEVVRGVKAAASELDRIGAECAEEKCQLEQLQLLHGMLDKSRKMFQHSVTVKRRSSECLELELELRNVSERELLGRFWSLQLEVRRSGDGRAEVRTFPLPSSLAVQGGLSLLLPLPRLRPRDAPLLLQGRLLFRGEGGRALLPSQTVVSHEVTVLELLTVTQTADSPFHRPRQPARDRAAFLACLGERQEGSCHAVQLSRAAVASSGVAVLLEAVARLQGHQRKSFLLDYSGTRLECEVEVAAGGQLGWRFSSVDVELVKCVIDDVRARLL